MGKIVLFLLNCPEGKNEIEYSNFFHRCNFGCQNPCFMPEKTIWHLVTRSPVLGLIGGSVPLARIYPRMPTIFAKMDTIYAITAKSHGIFFTFRTMIPNFE